MPKFVNFLLFFYYSAFITVRVSGLGENPRISSGGESSESSIEYTESPISTIAALPAQGSNEFAPEFESKSYSVQVLESAEPGSSVLKVKATDKDGGENGHVVYSLRYDENGKQKFLTVEIQIPYSRNPDDLVSCIPIVRAFKYRHRGQDLDLNCWSLEPLSSYFVIF